MTFLLNTIHSKWLTLTFLLMGTISGLSLWPLTEFPEVPGTDKIHHLIAYAALTFPVAFAQPKGWHRLLPVFIIFGGIIELIQPWVNRYADWLDLTANIGGVCLGSLCGWSMNKITQSNFSGRN